MIQNDISERYLKKAIAEMNGLGAEIAEAAGAERAPVLGSGHPQGEIFLLKHSPQPGSHGNRPRLSGLSL